jgi:SSS family solute:Na+ symporter
MILMCLAIIFSVAYYFAIISSASLVAIIAAAYGGVAQLMPVLLAAFYWRNSTRAGVIAGLLCGLTVNAFFLVMPEVRPLPLHEGVYGLTANVTALVVVSKLTKPPPMSAIMRFFR